MTAAPPPKPLSDTLNELDAQTHRSAIASAIGLLEEIELSLSEARTSYAEMMAEHLRETLADYDDHIRADVIVHLKTRIALTANGHRTALNELLGFAPEVTDEQSANIQEGLVADCVRQASVASDHNRRDELLKTALGILSGLGPLAIGRWRTQICQVAGIDRGTFDALITSSKKERKSADAPGGSTTATDTDGKPPVIKDTELRDRYVARHRVTAYGLGEWRRYEQGVWSAVHKSIIEREMMAVIDEESKRDVRLRPTAGLLRSVYKLVEVQVALADDKWNADPDMIICNNGALHIPTLELRAHSPEHYVTSGVPYPYDPDAQAPTWTRVLNELYSDAQEFLQEFAGYCVTTSTRYELAVWLYGDPGGGKSTFIAGLETMLGARAGVLGISDIERSGFMLTGLIGKTLVTATENPNDFLAAMYKLNSIISGEPIIVDIKHKDAITITSTAKILWSMNDLPRVTDANNGIFRRVKVVRVPKLPEAKRDPTIKETIKTEGPGILNWALAGLRRLNERGYFIVPETVRIETEEFKTSSDVEKSFVSDKCKCIEFARSKPSKLYQAYKDWCFDNGHKAKSSTRVARDWERLGFKKITVMGQAYWKGVEVDDDPVFIP